jgi:hypothetical protein
LARVWGLRIVPTMRRQGEERKPESVTFGGAGGRQPVGRLADQPTAWTDLAVSLDEQLSVTGLSARSLCNAAYNLGARVPSSEHKKLPACAEAAGPAPFAYGALTSFRP